MATPFKVVYERFLSKITNSMYLEITPEETELLLEDLLLTSIPLFEFPRVTLDWSKEIEGEPAEPYFIEELSNDEIDILAGYMVCAWLDQQVANIDLTKMIYTGADFKMTSQANHMQKLNALRKDYERKAFHLQRLYKRRKKDDNGILVSTFGSIMENSTGGYWDQQGGK